MTTIILNSQPRSTVYIAISFPDIGILNVLDKTVCAPALVELQ